MEPYSLGSVKIKYGEFVHVTVKIYTSNTKRIVNNILENF